VSAKVVKTASCSAVIMKRLPIQTSVLLTAHTKGATVAASCQVFCCPEQRRIPCVLCQLLFIGLRRMFRQTPAHEGRRWVSRCSSVHLGRGDGQGIQPLLHSSLAARHSNALPFVVVGEVVQD